MESMTDKLDRFYSLIKNYQEGAPNTRYKSWEWCHQAFLENRFSDKPETIELLALHLGFYLASWGMYRGSSYLLQRDYKAHKNAVKIILSDPNSILWDYEPNESKVEDASKLLFKENTGIYWKIKESYIDYKLEENGDEDDKASDTLVTKILMGTFGCVPAFDRFLKDGISNYKKYSQTKKIGNFKLSQNIEQYSGENFKALSYFAIENKDKLHIESDFFYPPMKLVDMYFWQTGYEIDIAETLEKLKTCNNENDFKKRKDLIQKTKGLSLSNSDDLDTVIKNILEKNQ